MKFFLIIILFLSIISVTSFSGNNYQDDEYYEDEEAYVQEGVVKAVNVDLGYFGPAGLSAAAGFRYWFASFTLGFSGIVNDIPNYALNGYAQGIYQTKPLPANFDEKNYPALIVTGDFAYHYQILPKVSAFASLGFYSQSDTTLAWDYSNDWYYYWKTQKSSGVAFGLGAEMDYQENLRIGLGYHTKRGIFARLSYYWY
ncbi:MAG: hypothetical protein A2X64_01340 [Ignavibacteria bacterium GWF2_33_9]|nr:MAG: hypothetical protein A2X64_01340 [Ignavibacteria bacterium GWF2_33_9]